MRPMIPMILLLATAGCDISALDLGGIDDWDGGGGGGGGGWDCCYIGTIRPVVTPELTLPVGSEFQLQARDLQGTPFVLLAGVFTSSDTLILAVSPGGWAQARAPGSVRVFYGEGGGLSASTDFSVGSVASATFPRMEVHGASHECGDLSVLDCEPAGSPIIDGWIGHSVDVAGISLTFVGADGLQPTDLVAAAQVAITPCQAEDDCVSVNDPSPDHAWSPSATTLCIAVTAGDSVPEREWLAPLNAEWVATWSRPGLFVLRQSFRVFVRPSLTAPASAC